MWPYLVIVVIGGLLVANESKAAVPPTPSSQPNPWTRFDALFKKYAQIYGVKWTWLKAIALNESDLGREKSVARGLANAKDIEGSKSSDGKSWGLMQVTLTTARTMDPLATAEKLNDPEYSISLAANYLSQLNRRFAFIDPRHDEWTIKSYNQGPGNTDKEKAGSIKGYAQEYWERWKRNLTRAEA
jgi:membrane-bound lytic murein transglycosylase MltF